MKPAQVTVTVDARGLLCPMPVVRASQAMQKLSPGDVLEVLATDQGSVTDMPAWAADLGHELLHWEQEGGVYRYYIRKGS